ncbi:SDR family NAD(P)-dependent oxidoreductase [Streptomyces sp. NPDC047973]|uniref:SDR family NAD(P)-dependent oxidoreductase n=1 Tax=Streptomyces sp. NPDC047973 TaxID=3155383 RepID=UPI00344640F1
MTAAGNAVITGAGSGLGRTIALELARRGYAVFGTARSQDEVDEVAAATDGHVQLLVCDITDETQVASFAAQVTMRTQGVVHLLVSNAGTLTPGPLESVSLDAARREFSVNTFGVLTVVNAFLPALRAARGRIVQVSTVSVDFPSPFNGLSAASKAAAETLMTVYRTELALSGVDVVVAVPGNMRTGGPARTAAAVERARAAPRRPTTTACSEPAAARAERGPQAGPPPRSRPRSHSSRRPRRTGYRCSPTPWYVLSARRSSPASITTTTSRSGGAVAARVRSPGPADAGTHRPARYDHLN